MTLTKRMTAVFLAVLITAVMLMPMTANAKPVNYTPKVTSATFDKKSKKTTVKWKCSKKYAGWTLQINWYMPAEGDEGIINTKTKAKKSKYTKKDTWKLQPANYVKVRFVKKDKYTKWSSSKEIKKK